MADIKTKDKTMSIKLKLILGTLLATIILATSITFVAEHKASSALQNGDMQKLEAITESKRGEITNYLDYIGGLLTSLAQQRGTEDAFMALSSSWYQIASESKLNLGTVTSDLKSNFASEYISAVNYDVPNCASKRSIDAYIPKSPNAKIAQYMFIVDNSQKLGEKNGMRYNPKYSAITYMQVHKRYHSSFNRFLESFGLYDIFMVDMKGNVIYTDFKEKDFSTNLKNGAYSNTGIARAYKKALNLGKGKIAFDDFKPYEPSYNAAAAFIATPIFVDGVRKGVMIFQMPVDAINKIMRFDEHYKEAGLGESGESYLVGSDYKMRSNSRFTKDIKDRVVQALGTTIGVWSVKTASTKAVIAQGKKRGDGIIDDYRGVSVLSAYATVNVYGTTKWAVVAEEDKSEVMKPAHELVQSMVITSVVVSLIIIALLFLMIKVLVERPLKELENRANDLAHGDGDLTARLEVVGKDEITVVSGHINSFIEKVQETIIQAKETGNENASVSEELARTSLSIGEKAEDELKIVDEVNAQGTQLQHVLGVAIANAEETKTEIGGANSSLQDSTKLIDELAEEINVRSQAELELAERLNALTSDANQVKSVLEVIGDIADQTNLLALNAAIEAARAGEHGRGFAVVADEVRKLAERTQKSLVEINASISVIVQSIGDASEAISENATEIEKLTVRANGVQSAISDSSTVMRDAVGKVDDMVSGYQDNTAQVGEMTHKIENIKELSTSNVRNVEEIASAADHLSGMTAKLNELLNSYKS